MNLPKASALYAFVFHFFQLFYLFIFVHSALVSPIRCHGTELSSTNVTNNIFTMMKLINMFVKIVLPFVPPQTYRALLIPWKMILLNVSLVNSEVGKCPVLAFRFGAFWLHTFPMLIVQMYSQTLIIIGFIVTIQVVTFCSFYFHMNCFEVSFFGL